MSALALCGAGLGLAVPVLSDAALDPGAGLTRSGTLTIGVRHLGLVAAIASIAPLLASDLPQLGDRAELKATAVLLDAPIGITDKVPIALDLRSAFNKAQDGEIPDLAEPFDKRGARTDSKLACGARRARRGDRGDDHARVPSRLPARGGIRRGGGAARRACCGGGSSTMKVLAALFAAAAVLIGVEFALGAAHTGQLRPRESVPAAHRFGGDVVQRVVLAGLDHAACRLHTSREELVLSLGTPFSSGRSRRRCGPGLLRAVDEAEGRGEIPALLAGPIRTLIRTAPIDKLISGGISLADLF